MFNDESSRQRFNEWVEEYEVIVPYECGAGIYENGQLYEDGFRYQTVMHNTCRHRNKKYTIYMEYMDWVRVEHFYTTFDDEDKVAKDSIIEHCRYYENNANILACTFELGYISNYEEYGLTDPWQTRAAW